MAATASELLDMRHPYRVPQSIGKVLLHVTHDPRLVGTSVGAFMHNSPAKVALRLAGGCKNMTRADKLDMVDYFVRALRGFKGLISSGATRQVDSDGLIDPMVTDVPAALVEAYGEDILTLSTVPRTGQMVLVDDSRFVLDDQNGILPQPGVHMIVVIQAEFSHEELGWDGDVDGYLSLYDTYRRNAGWLLGEPIWNGGVTTAVEAIRAAHLGWTVPVINGSARAADDLVKLVLKGTPIPDMEKLTLTDKARDNFIIAERDDPKTLRAPLVKAGFIASDS